MANKQLTLQTEGRELAQWRGGVDEKLHYIAQDLGETKAFITGIDTKIDRLSTKMSFARGAAYVLWPLSGFLAGTVISLLIKAYHV